MAMPEECLTENLLDRLRAAASPQEYLDADVTIDRSLSLTSMICLPRKG